MAVAREDDDAEGVLDRRLPHCVEDDGSFVEVPGPRVFRGGAAPVLGEWHRGDDEFPRYTWGWGLCEPHEEGIQLEGSEHGDGWVRGVGEVGRGTVTAGVEDEEGGRAVGEDGPSWEGGVGHEVGRSHRGAEEEGWVDGNVVVEVRVESCWEDGRRVCGPVVCDFVVIVGVEPGDVVG